MSRVRPSLAPGKHSGKQERPCLGLRGSACSVGSVHRRSSGRLARPTARLAGKWAVLVAAHAAISRECATFRSVLLPPCFPDFAAGSGEAKNGPEGPL
jgi:hypothetical protein